MIPRAGLGVLRARCRPWSSRRSANGVCSVLCFTYYVKLDREILAISRRRVDNRPQIELRCTYELFRPAVKLRLSDSWLSRIDFKLPDDTVQGGGATLCAADVVIRPGGVP